MIFMAILINGITSSVGQALLKIISDENEEVVGTGRDLSKLQGLQKNFKKLRIIEIPNLLDIENARKILEDLKNEHSITGYVHCTGKLNRYSDLSDITIEKWEDTIRVNLTSVFVWNKLMIEYFFGKKISGSIVNLTSQAFHTGGYSLIPDYAASKGGIVSLTKSLARWSSQYGIRINCVSPGFINNSMMQDGLSQEKQNLFISKIPLGRFAEPFEVAEVCNFLLKEKSSYITGEVIDVSGGQILG
jgi:3-oxoacyl-[acyl-carrier protein] reductase